MRDIFDLTGTPYVDLKIEAVCESCGHAYSGTKRIVAARRPLSFLPVILTQAERVQEKVESILAGDYRHLTVMRCPKCKYTQSWNVIGLRRGIAGRAARLAMSAATFVMLIQGLGKMVDLAYTLWTLLVISIAGGLVYWLVWLALKLYNPNRRHEPATQAILPQIVVTQSRL